MSKSITFFTSPTCAPCKTLLPKVLELSQERGITVEVIDIQKAPAVAAREGIMATPTLLIGDELIGPNVARPRYIAEALDQYAGV